MTTSLNAWRVASSLALVGLFSLIGSFRTVSAQTPLVWSADYDKLQIVHPFNDIWIWFKVNQTFVGTEMVLDEGQDVEGWNVSSLVLSRVNATHFGFHGPAKVAAVEGVHTLMWVAAPNTTATASLKVTIEVSCSDGDMCNGMERLIWTRRGRKKCASPKKSLCDDGNGCTVDICTNGVCTHKVRKSKLCPECNGRKCKPDCKNRVCGSDGCTGSCGAPCDGAAYCINGKCKVKDVNGTCRNPYDLTSEASALNWNGIMTTIDDTSKGINVIRPQCNSASNAPEIIYILKVPFTAGFIGLDARVQSTKKLPDGSYDPSALDTVLQLIEVDPTKYADPSVACLSANDDAALTPACADDSTPPGSYSSRITWMLKPGYTYFVHVDGYSARDVGQFLLTLRFSPQCTLQCQGKYCGPSGCPGFECGSCHNNSTCSADGLACIPPNCKPKCKNRQCGPDGCGACDSSVNKFCLNSKCVKFPKCTALLPRCSYMVPARRGPGRLVSGCPPGRYCASDCKCRSPDAKLPDLGIAAAYVIPEVVDHYSVESTSCALAEGCVSQAGVRRIVKFATVVYNQGDASFDPPKPPESRPDLFEWAPCHGHFHFQEFAKFELLNSKNETVVEGQKRSYCAEDTEKIWESHPRMPCNAKYTCAEQGISIGWADIYGPNLDCQFLDITDVPPGNYYIRQCANFRRLFAEKSFENNCIQTPFTLVPRMP